MKKPAIIIHLSDIQFGIHHRFTGRQVPENGQRRDSRYITDEEFNTLFVKLDNDLRLLKDTEGLTANVLVISGDLAEWSTRDEYRQVQKFIDSLLKSKNADLTRGRTILVPGNHDVNWNLCNSYFEKCQAHKRIPQAPYWEKFYFWNEFHSKLLGKKKARKHCLWYEYDLRSYGLLVAGLNSCVNESHKSVDHYGHLGIEQSNEVIEWFNKVDKNHEHVHIAVLHHNVFGHSSLDEENLGDWQVVRTLFEGTVDIILHGHRHEEYRTVVGQLDGRQIVVLGAGSAGLDGKTLPDCSNQYQLLKIDNRLATLYLRNYAQKQIGKSGWGQFIPDVDRTGKWKYDFHISQSVSISVELKSDTRQALSTSGYIDLERYVHSAKSYISRRLTREQEKVGTYLELDCINIRNQEVLSFGSLLDHWLRKGPPQVVLLGAAGSGKTVSCLAAVKKCYENSADIISGKTWLPIYLDLGKYATIDSALDILGLHFREHGYPLNRNEILRFLKYRRVVILLDGFDEYDKLGVASASDRTFDDFEHLCGQKTKLLMTCRSNFFRRPEDIFLYQLRARDFELCPESAIVVELEPLSNNVITKILKEFVISPTLPDWLYQLANRPLYLRMLVELLRSKAIKLNQDILRHELYERFILYVLRWDIIRSGDDDITLRKSRDLHIKLAEKLLDQGTSSLEDVELIRAIEGVFECRAADEQFSRLLFFFQESGLLRFEAGRIVFSHKSFREYLVAKKIYDLIVAEDDSFEFTWFTRDEREFIVSMLNESTKSTLCRWVANEDRYPACNYAAFILGGTRDNKLFKCLRERLTKTNDNLIKINCTNALAALGDNSVVNKLIGAVSGYALGTELLTVACKGSDADALGWANGLENKFGRHVMILHICESIEALSVRGDESAIDLLRVLGTSSDQSVADEAKVGLRLLIDRLNKEVESKRKLGSRTK